VRSICVFVFDQKIKNLYSVEMLVGMPVCFLPLQIDMELSVTILRKLLHGHLKTLISLIIQSLLTSIARKAVDQGSRAITGRFKPIFTSIC
jgi:hypothetical protein